jgi:hypothetical protein
VRANALIKHIVISIEQFNPLIDNSDCPFFFVLLASKMKQGRYGNVVP